MPPAITKRRNASGRNTAGESIAAVASCMQTKISGGETHDVQRVDGIDARRIRRKPKNGIAIGRKAGLEAGYGTSTELS